MTDDNEMREFPQYNLDKIMEFYNPDYRLLISAETGYRTARGHFQLREKAYHTDKHLKYAGFSELGFCLEQLTYAAFSEWLQKGRVEGFDIHFTDFLKIMNDGLMQVVGVERGRFRAKVERKTDKLIVCDIELTNKKRFGEVFVAWVNYSFEGGRANGKLEFGLALRDMKLDRNHRKNSRKINGQ